MTKRPHQSRVANTVLGNQQLVVAFLVIEDGASEVV